MQPRKAMNVEHREEDLCLGERQRRILELTEAQGYVTIEGLAQSFGVSAQTVRRDIIALDQAGLLQRFHGGAGIAKRDDSLRLGHERKQELDIAEKLSVAQKTAEMVPDGSTIFMDVGTTLETAATVLNSKSNLTVFTNSLRVALRFNPERHEVRVLAGRLSGLDGSITGEEAVMALLALHIEIGLIGCSGIDPLGRAVDFDLAKIALKRAAMRASRRSLLLATSSKFHRSARATIAYAHEFSCVISEIQIHERSSFQRGTGKSQ